ncbi:hypothetical protein O5165_25605, partial [Escherichia coli]|nr:hypothetical protein [Escherichia coli]
HLLSVIGDDFYGEMLLETWESADDWFVSESNIDQTVNTSWGGLQEVMIYLLGYVVAKINQDVSGHSGQP